MVYPSAVLYNLTIAAAGFHTSDCTIAIALIGRYSLDLGCHSARANPNTNLGVKYNFPTLPNAEGKRLNTAQVNRHPPLPPPSGTWTGISPMCAPMWPLAPGRSRLGPTAHAKRPGELQLRSRAGAACACLIKHIALCAYAAIQRGPRGLWGLLELIPGPAPAKAPAHHGRHSTAMAGRLQISAVGRSGAWPDCLSALAACGWWISDGRLWAGAF